MIYFVAILCVLIALGLVALYRNMRFVRAQVEHLHEELLHAAPFLNAMNEGEHLDRE